LGKYTARIGIVEILGKYNESIGIPETILGKYIKNIGIRDNIGKIYREKKNPQKSNIFVNNDMIINHVLQKILQKKIQRENF